MGNVCCCFKGNETDNNTNYTRRNVARPPPVPAHLSRYEYSHGGRLVGQNTRSSSPERSGYRPSYKPAGQLNAQNSRATIPERSDYRPSPKPVGQLDAQNSRITIPERHVFPLPNPAIAQNVDSKETVTTSTIKAIPEIYADDSDSENDNDSTEHYDMWHEAEMLARVERVSKELAQNFTTLLFEGCTLPFIARYRKTQVNYLMPSRLQELYISYQNILILKKKIKSIMETLRKSKKLTPEVKRSLLNAQNLSELELVYAPLKSQTLSPAEKARSLGLEPYAIKLLNGDYVNLTVLCSDAAELSTVDKVQTHITHLIADIICKDIRVLQKIRFLKDSKDLKFFIKTVARGTENQNPETKSDKYALYYDWKCPVCFVKTYQTLAINRGEKEKILSVSVVVPDSYYHVLERYCLCLWKSEKWVKKGLHDAYTRRIKPWVSRKVRNDLTEAAQKEAISTFSTNLENLLLTEPIKNRIIAGLDPGFTAGCKVGIIDVDGEMIEACKIHPNLKYNMRNDHAAWQLKRLLSKNNVELIGLGNGTACRETEAWLQYHGISVPVIIVPEQGASVYSISKEAQKEHPTMDPNLISALSIARRVLDPLGELIKVDPKYLGVGIYQHDIPDELLNSALDYTVQKIISLIGVDINTASLALLRRISGLNEHRAEQIITYRYNNGRFNTRAELFEVAGINEITFQQCAGFLKVLGGDEPLDATIIHPESYDVAKRFAKKINVNINELSQPHFPALVDYNVHSFNIKVVSRELNTDVGTLEVIINAFKQKPYEDNVIVFCKPVYSKSVQTTDELRKDLTITGVVRNVVPFGCFVDIGVGNDGLIHKNNLGRNELPKLGDRVSVTVIATPKPKRISLKLEKILS